MKATAATVGGNASAVLWQGQGLPFYLLSPRPTPPRQEMNVGKEASGRTIRSQEGVRSWIDECIALAEDARACEARAPSVSEWSVANHLEHLLKADRWIIGWIESVVAGRSQPGGEPSEPGDDASDPSADEHGRPSAVGYLVLSTGFIPRGRGRAPERSHPSGLTTPEILAGFRQVRAQVEALEPRLGEVDAAAITLDHPMLGQFTPAHWLRFADVHHVHHDKIVRDILAAVDD